MTFYYFLPVPELGPEVRDQSEGVELLAWLVGEGERVARGQAIARVQTRWAFLEITAAGEGVMGRLIFPPGTHVREGDPLAVVYADGDDLPYGRPPSGARVVGVREPKPARRRQDQKGPGSPTS